VEGGESNEVSWLGKGYGQREVGQIVIVAHAITIDRAGLSFFCSGQSARIPIRERASVPFLTI
jgi:hypothetical protein